MIGLAASAASTLAASYRARPDWSVDDVPLLDELAGLLGDPPVAPKAPEPEWRLRELTTGLDRHGRFNYLLSNGEVLFAHCFDKLSCILRQAPFATAHLVDEDMTVDFSQLTTANDKVAVIATTPLTDNEIWTAIPAGALLVFRDGERVEFDS